MKILRTTSLWSNFTGSYKKSVQLPAIAIASLVTSLLSFKLGKY